MRKWTYLVAALLLGGATATFTGCMDNEEPAGITDLRGAKAEFIRAKTAYELANVAWQNVQVEKEKVALESDKVTLEIKKLSLEKEQASTAWVKDSLKARQDTLAASVKEQLLAIQKKETETQTELQKALADLEVAMITSRDEAFTIAINGLVEELKGYDYDGGHYPGAIDQLRYANANLLKAKNSLLLFISENKFYEDILKADIQEAKEVLATQEKILADMKGFAATPTAEWNAKLADVSKQIAAINADIVVKKEAIAKLKLEIQPVEANIAREQAKLNTPDKSFTIPVVAPALQNQLAIQARMALGENKAFKDAFELDPTTNKYTMKADLVLAEQKLSALYLINNLITTIESGYNSTDRTWCGYISLFAQAYNNEFYSNISYDKVPTEVELAKAKGELTRMAIDKADKYKIFQKDSTLWMDAYKDYMTGLAAYENYLQTTTYDAIAVEITKYDAATATIEDANKLMAKLKKYGELRDKLDYVTGTWNNKKYYVCTVVENADVDATKDKISLSTFNNNIIGRGTYYLLGQSALLSWFGESSLPAKTGAIQRLCFASTKTFGTNGNLKNIIEPKKVGNEYFMPADIKPGNMNCSYAIYKTNAAYYDIFVNIETWIALDNSLNASRKVLDDQAKAISVAVATLQNSIAAQQDVIWKAELEIKLLNTDLDFPGNPYTGNIAYNSGKKQALGSLMATIKDAIENGGIVTYVVYNPNTNKFETKTGTIENLIALQNTAIEIARTNVATAEGKLEAYKTLGKDKNGRYLSDLEAAVKNAESVVASYQAAVDALNAQLKKLMDAYAKK